jgi:hypothetical protein
MIERQERESSGLLALALFPSSTIAIGLQTASTISSNSPKHSTPSTHFIHTRPRTTSSRSHTLVSVSEHHHGRQDGRRRGRLCSCRQRSHRRAAFTMYFSLSILLIAILTYVPAIIANFALLDQAVARFDGRFTLRVLRSISSVRKSSHLHDALSTAIASLYASHQDSPDKHFLESALQKKSSAPANGTANKDEHILPESFIYLAVLIQVQPCLSFSAGSRL